MPNTTKYFECCVEFFCAKLKERIYQSAIHECAFLPPKPVDAKKLKLAFRTSSPNTPNYSIVTTQNNIINLLETMIHLDFH